MPRPGFHRAEICNRYYPVDLLLEIPRVRVLRALRHFDAVSAADLAIALAEPDAYAVAYVLSTACKQGEVRRDDSNNPRLFSITALGRRRLAALIARGDLDVTPGMRP